MDAGYAHEPLCLADEQLAVDISLRGCQLSLSLYIDYTMWVP